MIDATPLVESPPEHWRAGMPAKSAGGRGKSWAALLKVYLGAVLPAWVFALLAILVGPWLFAKLLLGTTLDLSSADDVPFCLHYSIIGLMLGAVAWSPLEELLKTLRQLPISNNALARFFLFVPATLVAMSNLVLLIGYRPLYGAQWPSVGLALGLGVLTLLLTSAYLHLYRFYWWKLAAWLAAVGGYCFLLVSQFFPNGFSQGAQTFSGVSWEFATASLTAVCVAVFFGQQAMPWMRSRDGRASRLLQWLRLSPQELLPELRDRFTSQQGLANREPRSGGGDQEAPTASMTREAGRDAVLGKADGRTPQSALASLVRDKDRSVATLALGSTLLIVVPLCLFTWLSMPQTFHRLLGGAALCVGWHGLLIGLLQGVMDCQQERSRYLLSLPFSTATLSQQLVANLSRNVAVGASIALAIMFVVTATFGSLHEPLRPSEWLLWGLLSFTAPHVAMGMTYLAIALVSHNPVRGGTGVGGLLIAFVLAGVLERWSHAAFESCLAALAVCIMAACVGMWLAATRMRLVSVRALTVWWLIAGGMAAIVWTYFPSGPGPRLGWTLAGFVACSATPAIALAIHRLRHA